MHNFNARIAFQFLKFYLVLLTPAMQDLSSNVTYVSLSSRLSRIFSWWIPRLRLKLIIWLNHEPFRGLQDRGVLY